jgi:hypothetical protein
MIYNIINPSDAYTIAADDYAIAVVACLVLGNGQYGFAPVDGSKDKRVPLLISDRADEWCQKHFGMSAVALIRKTSKTQPTKLIDCLESCLIGDLGSREDFEEACNFIKDEAKQIAFKAARHDRRRTSMNDIGGRAYRMAAELRAGRSKVTAS